LSEFFAFFNRKSQLSDKSNGEKNEQDEISHSKKNFLNRFADMPAYVIAIVEDTREVTETDGKHHGEIELNIADCSDRISLYFNLNSAQQRANSLLKIKQLSETINEFRKALETEAESISNRKSSVKKPKTKSQTAR